MKKRWMALAASLTLLCGCQAGENAAVSGPGANLSKAQEIAVISADASEAVDTITDTAEIEHFVSALHIDQWKWKPLPDEASEIGSFGLSQAETIKLGQTAADGTRYEMAVITLYDGAYLRFEMGGFGMTFQVSEDTADYLNGYFE